jgi:ssDNA-binding replication factor A large subunit
VRCPLWDNTIERVEVGQSYKIENGYTGLFRGSLQVKIGRYSELKDAEFEIEDVNLNMDMSAKDHRTSRPRHYYQPHEGTGKGPEAVYRDRSYGRESRSNRNNTRPGRW